MGWSTSGMRHGLVVALAGAVGLATTGVASAAPTISNATLGRGDAAGQNLDSSGGRVLAGGWTTLLGAQNVPGNLMYNFFITQQMNPTSTDFVTPASSTSIVLNPGSNTFYWWADSDDQRGGSATFALNLFLDGAAPGTPSISGYTTGGVGSSLNANSSANTVSFDGSEAPGAGTLSYSDGVDLVTLTDFEVLGVGNVGGPASSDLVSHFTAGADGQTDTFGSFTLVVTPEPASLGVLGIGTLALAVRRRRAGK
jgi:hypothetical protein